MRAVGTVQMDGRRHMVATANRPYGSTRADASERKYGGVKQLFLHALCQQ
jgi:hypothetical protein